MEASARISASPYVDRPMNLISRLVPGSTFRARELDRGLKLGQNDVSRYSRPFSRKTGDFLARKFDAESNDGEIHRRRKIHPAKQIACYHSIFSKRYQRVSLNRKIKYVAMTSRNFSTNFLCVSRRWKHVI